MKKYFYFLGTVLLLFSGCTPEDGGGDSTPYFKFSNADKTKLINADKIGSVIKYKNQFNVIKQFDVNSCSINRSGYGFASFWGSATSIDYYYDTQQTYVSHTGDDGYISYTINFQTVPTSSDYSSYPYEFSNPRFSGSIDFSLFNNCNDINNISCGFVDAPNYLSGQSMDINGKHYDNVTIVQSGNNSAIGDRTSNKFYYSTEYGIIGYDEIDGTNWRRVD